MSSGLRFRLRPETFCIHRLPLDRPLELDRLSAASWFSVTRTEDELSVVAPEAIDLGPGEREPGWSCLQIDAVLDFAAVGIIAGISRLLADAQISVFAVSTYNTDYFLVRQANVETAVRALTGAGHTVTKG